MICAVEGKGRIIGFKVYGVTLRAPAITTCISTQDGRQNKEPCRVNNYQYSQHVYM